MSRIAVEVVYAHPHRHHSVSLTLAEGSCVQDALQASGILGRCPELQVGSVHGVGIHARRVGLDALLRDRDRVEIYRPLLADPKAARRRTAKV